MSDTPRTDAAQRLAGTKWDGEMAMSADFARTLERELAEIESAAMCPIMSIQEFGTPGRVIGVRCLLCNEEAALNSVFQHDKSCVFASSSTT